MSNIQGIIKISAILGTLPFIMAGTCDRPNLKGFEASLKEADYRMYYPARTNWGPNTVLAADLSGNRLKNVREICSELYLFVKPKTDSVALANYTATNDREFSLGVEFLKSFIGPDLSAKLGLEAEDKETLKIAFSNTVEDSLADTITVGKGGRARRIEPDCEKRLKQLKQSGEFQDRVFVVLRALRAGVSYSFKEASKFKADGQLTVAKALGAKAGVGWKSTGATSLTVKNSHYVAVARGGLVKLAEWLPAGQISGGFYKSTLSPIDIEFIEVSD